MRILDLSGFIFRESKENGIESQYYLIEGDHFTAIDEFIKVSIEVFKRMLIR